MAARADVPPPPAVTVLKPIAASSQELGVKLAMGPIKVAMLAGEDLGHGALGGWTCTPSQRITLTDASSKLLAANVNVAALQELKSLGYPLAGVGNVSAFDTDINSAPDFRVGAVIRQYRQETCTYGALTEGWIYLKADWALFSEKEQRVVFQRSTEGLAVNTSKAPDLLRRTMLVSIDNFLAAPEVLQALRDPSARIGAAPTSTTAAIPAAATATADHWLTLARQSPHAGGAQKNQERLRNAVVVLESAAGSGSGFYVTRSGYLMTDYHVVKGSKYVKVKLPNGDKMVAQVVRASERDDVALLKTVAIDFDPLAIRETPPDVGVDVYAIGAPLGVLTSTLTRGVLSADRVLQGKHILQSDAAVTFGSSGGPLLDDDGRVIGLTKGGIAEGKGFNFFIPVLDALRALDLGIGAADLERTPDAAAPAAAVAPAAVPAAAAAPAAPAVPTPPADARATDKPVGALPLSQAMLVGRTWVYPHPVDPGRFGSVELNFTSAEQVLARNAKSRTVGTYAVNGDQLCTNLVSWGRTCVYMVENAGQKSLVFAGNGRTSPLQIR